MTPNLLKKILNPILSLFLSGKQLKVANILLGEKILELESLSANVAEAKAALDVAKKTAKDTFENLNALRQSSTDAANELGAFIEGMGSSNVLSKAKKEALVKIASTLAAQAQK